MVPKGDRHPEGQGLAQAMTLRERLAAIPYTGAISDILDEMGLREQVLPHEIRSLRPGQIVAGCALTVLGEPAAGLARDDYFVPFLKMLGSIEAGDVVVIQPNDSAVAHFGELSAETAKSRGGAGVVVDGGVRDVEYLLKLGFPAYARYTTPQDMVGRWRLVDINVPVTIGRVRVCPGDYVLGDRDGLAIIPRQVAEEAIGRAEEVIRAESHIRTAVIEGIDPVTEYQQYGRF
jgi:4-hydroxy-4-methyl-2-oxoglutarate aldolase